MKTLGLDKSKLTKLAVVAGVLVLLAGLLMYFARPGPAVSGVITYDDVSLPEGSKLFLSIRDVTYADAPSITIAEEVIVDPGPPPLSFRIAYDSADIDPRNVYSVGARISGPEDQLFFINDTAFEVITRGKPSRVEMDLVTVVPID